MNHSELPRKNTATVQDDSSRESRGLISNLPENILMIKKTFVKIFCGLKRQKRNFFELCYIWCKPYVTANMSIKHGGGTEEETSGQTKAETPKWPIYFCTSVHLLLKQKESWWLLFTCMWALVKWVHIACCSNVIVCEHLCIFENDFL